MNTYEDDFYAWTLETAEKLRQGKWSEINVTDLIEEIEDMGGQCLAGARQPSNRAAGSFAQMAIPTPVSGP